MRTVHSSHELQPEDRYEESCGFAERSPTLGQLKEKAAEETLSFAREGDGIERTADLLVEVQHPGGSVVRYPFFDFGPEQGVYILEADRRA